MGIFRGRVQILFFHLHKQPSCLKQKSHDEELEAKERQELNEGCLGFFPLILSVRLAVLERP